MKKALVIGLISLITSCCSKIYPSKDDFLTIPKTQYSGNELRIDGFFYRTWENGTKYSDITFLYNDGVLFQGNGAGDLSQLMEYAQETLLHHDQIKDKKAFWGLFLVKDNKIMFERWKATQSGYLVYREEGVIIDDTTFVMTEVSRINHGIKTETKPIEWTYYFCEFSAKPDSTNTVIGNY